MHGPTIIVVFGTRPEAIKMAPIVRELRARAEIRTVVCVTSQHRQMLDQVLEVFDIRPDHDLDVMLPSQGLGELTARILTRMESVLASERPQFLLVQGDTTTTFAASLAAFYQQIPVGHVEAGRQTYDRYAPFPEELNRCLTTRLASIHFAPTSRNKAALLREGIAERDIVVTGNTVIDALHWAVQRGRLLPPVLPRTRPRRIFLTVHRRESQGEAMRGVCAAVRALAARGDTEIVFPVHPSPAVREIVVPELEGVQGVHLCDPVDYLTAVQVLDSCDVVLTDSGGLQEEGPALGKPVLVLRETTERPEAVEAGVARLVGTRTATIVGVTGRLLDDPQAYASMAHAESPFGDGRARFRIVRALTEQRALSRAA
jgi:UDP-N-acetylglucosamine 2-epimerase (non-hydrolysing)